LDIEAIIAGGGRLPLPLLAKDPLVDDRY